MTNTPAKKLLRILTSLERRLVRSRPGSVLIMVVALLVLMALIGTAYISTAQYDRASSQQHEYNTQVDLLLQSVIEMAKGQILNDIIDPNAKTPNLSATLVTNPNPYRLAGDTNYNHYDGLGWDPTTAAAVWHAVLVNGVPPTNPGSTFLADRVPTVFNNT